MAKTAWLLCLTATTLVQRAPGADIEHAPALSNEKQQHLAVILPVYHRDLQLAVSSLERWPVVCSSLTQRNVDLILYYAEGEEYGEEVNEAVDTITQSAGQCFARTRVVYASLDKEEGFHSEYMSSVLFYKMFLDQDVRADLVEYDALAIVEWDILVAADSSFEELYKAAFNSEEDFWVKGSNSFEGVNFHTTPDETNNAHILGYINGNAIYNNNDPEFVDYVDYTFARWQYDYPYDVALWLTISDIPYGRSLSQRYSRKFVTMNLISHAGVESMDGNSVSNAVGNYALFIQSSKMNEANVASWNSVSKQTSMPHQLRATSRSHK